jgi:pimeloyl-ACP methyl ester carboxylesterase
VAENMAELKMPGYAAATRLLRDGALLDDVAALDLPALVLCGSEDAITPPDTCRQVATAFGGACGYREIEGAGHASYIENPAAFNEHLRVFAGDVL